MPKLSEPDIQAQMTQAKGWDRHGDMLVRTWQFASARRALEFVNRVGELAERSDHYPEVCLNYRAVRVELTTHADGGLTPRDFELAAEINALPSER